MPIGAMEAANGVESEIVSEGPETVLEADELCLTMNKENEIINGGSDAFEPNGASEDPSKVEGANNPSAVTEEASPAVPRKKVSNLMKSTKAVITRTQSMSLSKSMPVPAKSVPANGLRKSATFVKQRKTDAKNSGRPEVVSSRPANGGLIGMKSSLATLPSIRRSMPMSSGSMDATIIGTPSEGLRASDGNKKPLRCVLSVKNEDDAHSTTSSTTPRAAALLKSSVGFTSRLDERAEKRKEFFTKLEEKVHAKEMEKTHLQVKSKENQEAEIKQLRKSLTFKATPIPSFYQEPGPPKVELKKVPPTRPRSPKLGRHKTSAIGAEIYSDSKVSRSDLTNKVEGAMKCKPDPLAPKKQAHRPLSKLPSQRLTSVKSEATTLIGSKPKASKPKQKTEKTEEINDVNPSAEIDSLKNTTEVEATIPDALLDPGITPHQVLVEG